MAQPAGPPKTIVVAVADATVADKFSNALHGAGHLTFRPRTREELLTQLRTRSAAVDLIVLDLGLGGQGSDLVRAIQALDSDTPVVVLSGSVGTAAAVRDLAGLGVDSYVNEHCAGHQILPSLAPRLFPDSFNRRTSRRVRLDLPVAYRFSDTVATAPTLDLSKGGLGVRTMTPPPVGTKIHARFRLPGSQTDIEADSRVAWSDHRAGMGLQFEQVQSPDQSAVDEFVDLQSVEGGPSV